jgi:hypothetical protein
MHIGVAKAVVGDPNVHLVRLKLANFVRPLCELGLGLRNSPATAGEQLCVARLEAFLGRALKVADDGITLQFSSIGGKRPVWCAARKEKHRPSVDPVPAPLPVSFPGRNKMCTVSGSSGKRSPHVDLGLQLSNRRRRPDRAGHVEDVKFRAPRKRSTISVPYRYHALSSQDLLALCGVNRH